MHIILIVVSANVVSSDVSRPNSYFLAEPSPNAIPTPRSKYSVVATPTVYEARFVRQLPISTFNSQSNALKRNESEHPALPKLVTVPKRALLVQPPTTIKHDESAFEKELPPPPPKKEISPQRTIVPRIDPDIFPMPEERSSRNKKNTSRILRTVQSIGILQSGPKTGDYARFSTRPGTARSNSGFHKRLFSGRIVGSTTTVIATTPSTESAPSIFSIEQSTPRIGRRLSQLSRRKGSQALEDPLAPVSIIPVMSNHEDVAGGLTYLPRYTNNFAGFCKSMYRLWMA